MIVSHGSSQVVYRIDSVDYTCYTPAENRIIASIILEEEYCDSLLVQCANENDELNNQLSILNNQYIESKRYNNELSIQLDNCILVGREYEASYFDTRDKLKRTNTILYTSLTANLILILITIL